MTTREMWRRARANYASYCRSDRHSLMDAYDRPSTAKQYAWRHCEDLCAEYGGRNLKVISRNTHMFTAGFEFDCPSTGVLMFMYISKDYHKACEVTQF